LLALHHRGHHVWHLSEGASHGTSEPGREQLHLADLVHDQHQLLALSGLGKGGFDLRRADGLEAGDIYSVAPDPVPALEPHACQSSRRTAHCLYAEGDSCSALPNLFRPEPAHARGRARCAQVVDEGADDRGLPTTRRACQQNVPCHAA